MMSTQSRMMNKNTRIDTKGNDVLEEVLDEVFATLFEYQIDPLLFKGSKLFINFEFLFAFI